MDFPPAEACAVLYYGQGDAVSEFLVLGTEFDDALMFNGVEDLSYSSGWQTYAASTPEPTSGLLMLLGVAGLALKRKIK